MSLLGLSSWNEKFRVSDMSSSRDIVFIRFVLSVVIFFIT